MSNAQKTPFVNSLNRFTKWKIDNALQQFGQALPCHVIQVNGPIVTIAFDIDTSKTGYTIPQVTIPVAMAEYIRLPIQAGTKGMTIPADVSLRGVTGLGTGIADLTPMPNLTALAFLPVGNINWFEVDPNILTMYGPNGASIGDKVNTASVLAGGGEVAMKGNLTVSGNVSAGNGITCMFTTPTGQTVMVQNGIVTNIY